MKKWFNLPTKSTKSSLMMACDACFWYLSTRCFSVYTGRCRGILPQLCQYLGTWDSVLGSRGQLKSDIGKVLDRNDARVADVGLPSLMSCLALQLSKMQTYASSIQFMSYETLGRWIFDWFWQRVQDVQESVPGSLGWCNGNRNNLGSFHPLWW